MIPLWYEQPVYHQVVMYCCLSSELGSRQEGVCVCVWALQHPSFACFCFPTSHILYFEVPMLIDWPPTFCTVYMVAINSECGCAGFASMQK